MKKLSTGTMLAFATFTTVLVCSGCQSATEDTAATPAPSSAEQAAPQTASQADSNAAPPMSPEAAKAAEDAMRRDKRGY